MTIIPKNIILTDKILYAYLVAFPIISQFQPLIYKGIGIDNLIILSLFLITIPVINKSVYLKGLTYPFTLMYLLLGLIGLIGLIFGIESNTLWRTPLVLIQISIILLIIYLRKEKIEYFSKAFLFGGVIAGLFGIAQFFSEWAWIITDLYYLREEAFWVEDSYAYMNRIASVSFFPPNGNFFGSYMVFSILISFMLNKGSLHKNNYIWLNIIFIPGLLLSLSWTSIGSLLIAIIIVIIYRLVKVFSSLKARKSDLAVFFSFLLFMGSSVVAVQWILKSNVWAGFLHKFNNYFLTIDPTTGLPGGFTFRLLRWKSYLIQLDNPFSILFGLGYGYTGTLDNFLIQTLVANGLLGLIIMISILSILLKKKYKLFENNKFPFIAILIYLILNTMAAYALYIPVVVGVSLMLLFKKSIGYKNIHYKLS